MKLLLQAKKAATWVRDIPLRVYLWLIFGLSAFVDAFAVDPFGDMNINAVDLESKTGSTTSSTLQYILIGVGVILCASCASKVWVLVSGEKRDKEEQSNGVIQMLLLILGAFIGLVLIGIGWKGATAVVTPG